MAGRLFAGSELLIIHDRDLWQLLDDWITQLHDERFLSILPLLRRTFSSFSEAARAKMHDRVRAARTSGDDQCGRTAL